jgi:hypothetical protein
VQDFFWAEVLNGDWKPLADDVLKALDGYRAGSGSTARSGASTSPEGPRHARVVHKRMHQGLDVCAASRRDADGHPLALHDLGLQQSRLQSRRAS